MIHPQSHISPKASLGEDVKIGPGVLIDEGCKIGGRCEIRANAIITGNTSMGENNQIGYGAVVGAEPQDFNFKGESAPVTIGDNNIIREHVTIHRGTQKSGGTKIGNENFLMVGCHVAHDCHIFNHVIIVNGALLAGAVEVQDRAILGGAAVVHQGVRIGQYSILRGNIGVGKDVPPFLMAVNTNAVSGLNRIGLRRSGFSLETRHVLQNAYNILYKQGFNVTQALVEIEKNLDKSSELDSFISFIRSSRRGICSHYKKEKISKK